MIALQKHPRALSWTLVLLVAGYSFGGCFPRSLHDQLTDSAIERGTLLCKSGDNEGALKEYTRALTLRPNDTCILMNIGICQQNAGKYNEALQAFEKVLAREPDNNEARHHTAVVHFHLKEYAKGKAELLRLITVRENALDHHYLARCLNLEGLHTEAIKHYLIAIDLDPKEKANYSNLANVYYKIHDFKKAADTYKQAFERFPDKEQESLYWAGRSLEKLGQKEEALSYYERYLAALKKYPDSSLSPLEAQKRIKKLKGGITASFCSTKKESCEERRLQVERSGQFQDELSELDKSKLPKRMLKEREQMRKQDESLRYSVTSDGCVETQIPDVDAPVYCFYASAAKP